MATSFALSALVFLFAALMGLWPLAWLFVVVRHSLSRRWRRVGQVALLLPLWTIAASVGAVQFARLLAARDAAAASPNLLIAATSIGVALCVATVAWLLLIRSFGDRPSEGPADQSAPASPP